jgi:hypothetical protein
MVSCQYYLFDIDGDTKDLSDKVVWHMHTSFVERESGRRVGKLETRMPRKVVWEETAVIDEDAVKDRGLERTIEETVGAGSVVLVVTFSATRVAEKV